MPARSLLNQADLDFIGLSTFNTWDRMCALPAKLGLQGHLERSLHATLRYKARRLHLARSISLAAMYNKHNTLQLAPHSCFGDSVAVPLNPTTFRDQRLASRRTSLLLL